MKRITLKQIKKLRHLYFLSSHWNGVSAAKDQQEQHKSNSCRTSAYKQPSAGGSDTRVYQLVCKMQTVLKLRSILAQVGVDEINDKLLSARKIKSLKEAHELGLLTLFNKPTSFATEMGQQGFALYDKHLLFGDCFVWIFSQQIGYYIEVLLLECLNSDAQQGRSRKNKVMFREMFLEYLNKQKPFVYCNKPVKNYSLKRLRVFFNTNSLIRILRLIVVSYNYQFWLALNAHQKQILLKQVIKQSQKTGSFIYITSFLNPILFKNDSNSLDQTYSFINNILVLNNFSVDLNWTNGPNPREAGIIKAVTATGGEAPFRKSTTFTKSVRGVFKTFLVWGGLFWLLAPQLPFLRERCYISYQSPTMIVLGPTAFTACPKVLPLAAMSLYGSTGKSNNSNTTNNLTMPDRSRAGLKVLNYKGLDIDSNQRKMLTVMVSSNEAKLLLQGKNQTINLTTHYVGEQNVAVIDSFKCFADTTNLPMDKTKKTSKLSDDTNSILNYKLRCAETKLPLVQALYQRTPLGSKNPLRPELLRSLKIDILVLDVDNKTDAEWNVLVNFNQKNKVENYILKNVGRLLQDITDLSELEHIKQSQFYENALSLQTSKSSFYGEAVAGFGNLTGSTLFNTVRSLISLPESYQAAHSIPKKITAALGLDHESQLTMHTIKEANAKTSYDNLLVNLYNFVKSNSLAELLTSNLDIGKDLLSRAISSKIHKENYEGNGFALILLGDLAHDTYTKARIEIGLEWSKPWLDVYQNATGGAAPRILDYLGSTFCLNQAVIEVCSNNTKLAVNFVDEFYKKQNTRVLSLSDDLDYQQIKQEYLKNLVKDPEGPNGFYTTLSTSLATLLIELDAAKNSFDLSHRLCYTNSIIHGLITNKDQSACQTFVTETKNMIQASSTSKLPSPINSDEALIAYYHTYGSKLNAQMRELSNNITCVEKKLELIFKDLGLIEQQQHLYNEQEQKNATFIKLFLQEQIQTLNEQSLVLHNKTINFVTNSNPNLSHIDLFFTDSSINYTQISNELQRYVNTCKVEANNAFSPKLEDVLTKFKSTAFNKKTLSLCNNYASNTIESSSLVTKQLDQQYALVDVKKQIVADYVDKYNLHANQPITAFTSSTSIQKPVSLFIRGSANATGNVIIDQQSAEAIGNVRVNQTRAVKLGSEPVQAESSRSVRMVSHGDTVTPAKKVGRPRKLAPTFDQNDAAQTMPMISHDLVITPKKVGRPKKTVSTSSSPPTDH